MNLYAININRSPVKKLTFPLILSIALILILATCKKEDKNTKPAISTIEISEISFNSAKSGGIIEDDGGLTIISKGVCWSEEINPSISDSVTLDGSGAGNFTSNIANLIADKEYFVRAYATNSIGTGYGMSFSFKTPKATTPALSTNSVTNVTHTSALSGGTITSNGGSPIVNSGVIWDTILDPSLDNYLGISLSETPDQNFITELSQLVHDRTYYVRAFATNDIGTSYGQSVPFTTLAVEINFAPVSVSNIRTTQASFFTEITSDGGIEISERGFCWNIIENPVIDDINTVYLDNGMGVMSANIANLEPNKTYYVRAFALNEIEIKYSEQVAFTTLNGLASLQLLAPSDITANSAVVSALVSSDGGSDLLSKGFCWSANPNPNVNDNIIELGSGSSAFNAQITNLNYNSSYYFRAFGTNSYGTHYSNEQQLTTLSGIPAITSPAASNIMHNQVTLQSAINEDNGLSVQSRGFVWGSNPGVTIDDNIINAGSGMGSFTETLTGLGVGATYYIKSFAINERGVFYGASQITVETIDYPSVTTNDVSGIVQTRVIAHGSVTGSGNAPAVARGFVYGLNPNPTTDDIKIPAGIGIGEYTSNIANLSPNTTYHLRAYAENMAGIIYGENLSFTTVQDNLTITDFDGNTYATVTIGNQIWMAENLKTTAYNDGTPIPEISDPFVWTELTTGALVWYDNDISWKDYYGGLYNWHAAKNENSLCPTGWVVPSHDHFQVLSIFLGGNAVSGGKLKSTRTDPETHPRWNTPNAAATNSSSWSGLGAGLRGPNGNFSSFGLYGRWWSSSETENMKGNFIELTTGNGTLTIGNGWKHHGYSIRCIKSN